MLITHLVYLTYIWRIKIRGVRVECIRLVWVRNRIIKFRKIIAFDNWRLKQYVADVRSILRKDNEEWKQEDDDNSSLFSVLLLETMWNNRQAVR
jgi:hypothetical protein